MFIPTHKPLVARRFFARQAAQAFIGCILIGIAFVFMACSTAPQAGDIPEGNGSSQTATANPVEKLARAHNCWTANQQAKGLPNGAIVLLHGKADPVYTDAPALVSAAFDAALGERELPKRIEAVYGFCLKVA